MKLGILTSHPIQYQAPWFRALAREVDLVVYFAHQQSPVEQGEAGYGLPFEWDVDLLSGYRHHFLVNRARRRGVDRFTGTDTPEIDEKIRSESFDAFLVCGWHLRSYWQAALSCRRHGIPVMARGDSQLQTPRSALARAVKAIVYPLLLSRFDGFLAVGQRNRQYLEHYGVPGRRIFDAPHCVDNRWFRKKADEARSTRALIRETWGRNQGHSLWALFVGRFVEMKRPADLLLALARTRDPVIGAVFVGSGQLETSLREEARRLGVKAHFAGFRNQAELAAHYAAADFLVLPSEGRETWGLVVNEAMACGLPAVVSVSVGCAPDLIQEGETGFTFPVGDVEALADKISMIGRLKTRGHDFEPALNIVLERHSIGAAISGTMAAAESLIGRKSAPRM